MFDKKLKSGRKVKIKELTEDQIADLKDMATFKRYWRARLPPKYLPPE